MGKKRWELLICSHADLCGAMPDSVGSSSVPQAASIRSGSRKALLEAIRRRCTGGYAHLRTSLCVAPLRCEPWCKGRERSG